MKAFTKLTSKIIPLPIRNVDTDQIIPARYLKVTDKAGLAEGLFYDWRYQDDGTPDPEFVMNQPAYQDAKILLAGDTFGCGSSREHAVWVFEVNDINMVIAESFARIFRQNMFNCGMLAVELESEEIDSIFALGEGVEIGVDMDKGEITVRGRGKELVFSVDLNPFDSELVKAGGWLSYADQKY